MTAAAVADGLLEEANDLLADAVDLRRRIHRHPELGLELPVTQEAVLEAIEGLGLTVTTGRDTTSVTAVLEGEGGDGPTVLLRGDMDALPMPEDTGLDYASDVDGAMHACGHDAHVAMLAGAARLLAGRRRDIAGRVVFMFQPGEEGHHGARVMLDEGLLELTGPVDLAFAIHATPTMPAGVVATRPGPLMASADTLRVTVRGRGGHASQPHHALDPIPVACEIVTAIQAMVTRRVDAFNPAVVTVAQIQSGTTSNVIPESAELLGTVRTFSKRTRQEVGDGLRRLCEGIAAAHGAEADVEIEAGYPVTVNGEGPAAHVLDIANGLIGPERTVTMPTPVMGAEDWSYVLDRVPGAMAFLGMRPSGVTGPVPPNHSNRMTIEESPMVTGIAMHAAVALSRVGRALH